MSKLKTFNDDGCHTTVFFCLPLHLKRKHRERFLHNKMCDNKTTSFDNSMCNFHLESYTHVLSACSHAIICEIINFIDCLLSNVKLNVWIMNEKKHIYRKKRERESVCIYENTTEKNNKLKDIWLRNLGVILQWVC